MTIDLEKFFIESEKLNQENKEEINLFDIPLDIDKDTYRHCFSDKSFVLFEMRKFSDKGSELVGYAAFFMYYHAHHKTRLSAKQDVIFIRKDHRGRGVSFIKYCDKILKKIGVEQVLHSVPEIKDWSLVLKRLGYSKLETIYSKEL